MSQQPPPSSAGAASSATPHYLTSTTFELPGYVVERTLGVAFGLIVRSTGFTRGLTGGLRSLQAGEIPEFTEVVTAARTTALERMWQHTLQLGGNAVLGVRFDSSNVGDGHAEVIAYGTAAVVRLP